MICPYCETPVLKNDKRKQYINDLWCSLYHTDCFTEWRTNCERFYAELERPMNECKFFVRTGSSMHGYYVRENANGKTLKHPCLAMWKEADIFGTALFNTPIGKMHWEKKEEKRADALYQELSLDLPCVKIIVDNTAFLEAFRAFLIKNGWYPKPEQVALGIINKSWFVPRKPYEYPEEVREKRQYAQKLAEHKAKMDVDYGDENSGYGGWPYPW